MANEISNNDDLIDIRDVIERFEQLEGEIESIEGAENFDPLMAKQQNADTYDEHADLENLLKETAGTGGDHQWRGDWYPVTLIRDSYFEDHARELAADIGAIDPKATWPNNCIDWEKAAQELQQDYTTVEFRNVTYWYR